MELNWSTFVLEILNFLILVWILKRFLYGPVLNVIARRQAGIEKTLADAEACHADAQALRARYEGRLAEWEQERQQTRDAMVRDVEDERARRLSELQSELERLRETARVADERRRADSERRLEETALAQGARFATRLLEQASGPDTETRLVDLAIDELAKLPAERIEALRNGNTTTHGGTVSTAYALDDERHRRLVETLETVFAKPLSLHFQQDPQLCAGIHIELGAWVLAANVRDELKGLVELAHDE